MFNCKYHAPSVPSEKGTVRKNIKLKITKTYESNLCRVITYIKKHNFIWFVLSIWLHFGRKIHK